ncbi:hypothetical protein QR680_014198 [Steinernema hermaphroditum]|uniref:Uncharacterized protein n=1 Tax=Steinernema hermaphroditum TaxID=289476 RepID=A0AA39M3M7_9BILA|nr:hypothetical protein QR680_014198 [Steinernema hermaphroditum]
MDAVPYIFIDRVVELFDSLTLSSSLASRLKKGTWRNVLHLHRRNRRYYELGVRIRDSNIECLLMISAWTAEEIEKEDNSPTLHVETTDLDRKFARIREISNYPSYDTGTPQLTFRQDEVDKVLKFMLPFYVYGNINIYSLSEPFLETQFLDLMDERTILQFLRCCCDTSEECSFNEELPKLHAF